MSKASRLRNPDAEPFPYPPNSPYRLRSPLGLTIVGGILTLGSIVFLIAMIGLALQPRYSADAGVIITMCCLLVAGTALTLWIGIVRLRWQRGYLRKHGVLPVMSGQRPPTNS
jgi:hypothetical protein